MKVMDIYFANSQATKYYKQGEIISGSVEGDRLLKVIHIEDSRLVVKPLNWFETVLYHCKCFFTYLWWKIEYKFGNTTDSLALPPIKMTAQEIKYTWGINVEKEP